MCVAILISLASFSRAQISWVSTRRGPVMEGLWSPAAPGHPKRHGRAREVQSKPWAVPLSDATTPCQAGAQGKGFTLPFCLPAGQLADRPACCATELCPVLDYSTATDPGQGSSRANHCTGQTLPSMSKGMAWQWAVGGHGEAGWSPLPSLFRVAECCVAPRKA